MATFIADVYTAYTKPSLDGRIVMRKATARQTSARLAKRKEAVAVAGRAGKIAKAAHDELVAKGKCPSQRVYKPGVGYKEEPVCPIKLMKPVLREKMKAVT